MNRLELLKKDLKDLEVSLLFIGEQIKFEIIEDGKDCRYSIWWKVYRRVSDDINDTKESMMHVVRQNTTIPLEERFDILFERWQHQSCIHSFRHTICLGTAYESILRDLGKDVLPFVFKKLRDGDRGSWNLMYLLEDFLGDNQPFLDASTTVTDGWVATDNDGAVRNWVRWGEQNGYLPYVHP